MKVGNEAGRNDIVYTTVVGENKPGSVKISDNSIHITESKVVKRVDISNHPLNANVSLTKGVTTKSFFNIEPGRCFHSDIGIKSLYNKRRTISSIELCSMSKMIQLTLNLSYFHSFFF